LTPLEALRTKPRIECVPGTACTVCGGEQWTQVGSGQDFEYETCSNEWSYRSCNECGHVQIDPLPSPGALSTIYPPNYYSYVMNESIHPLARWAKGLLDRAKFRQILSGTPRAASYLDVGCGDGRYLELMISKGVDRSRACGVELDGSAVAAATRKGLRVEQCRIEDATHLTPGEFDLITMFHVIEHIARPDDVVRRLYALLSAGGTLAIETPNFDSLDARIGRRRFWGGYHIPRHWHIFTPQSLQRLLAQAGFSVAAIRYQTGHAFWLWTLHHWLKYGLGWPRLAAFCHPLRNVPLLAAVTAFDKLRSAAGSRTSAILILARKNG
jgi:2-polyprenyl-3-methyl-5-hydroxy-6-metoxy-1,4-benzoquinol methylase